MTEITQLTSNIETNYPDLYRTLDEEPITIPNQQHPDINDKVLHDYLTGLKQILKSFIETHHANNLKKS